MNFIAPEFLYALGFLAIPIIIHLFNFRRYKTVQFSQVRFLKDVKKKTQSTSRLKHLLVLLARCLAVAALVFAFAQPFLADETEEVAGKKGVIIYVDNSFSMQQSSNSGSLLDIAKNKAISIVSAFSDADKFQLHTNEFYGKQQRWLNKEGFINELQNVEYSSVHRTYKEVLSRIQPVDQQEYLLRKYLISDMQKSNVAFNETTDSSSIFFLAVQANITDNAWINDVSSYQPFHLAEQNEKISTVIKASMSDDEKSFNGSLLLNGKVKAPFSVNLAKDSTLETFNYNNPAAESINGEVIIKDYPVTFDDTFYFSYQMQPMIDVLHIYEEVANENIASLYQGDSLINYTANSVKQLNYELINTVSLIVLDRPKEISSGMRDAIQRYVKDGGDLVLFPNTEMDVNSINQLLASFQSAEYKSYQQDTMDVVSLNTDALLFANVFEEKPQNINLPRTYGSWQIQSTLNAIKQDIFALRNGNSFLSSYETEGGRIYLFSSSLDDKASNFGRHAIFVPILFNMALQSVNTAPIAYRIGESQIRLKDIAQKESPLRLKKGSIEVIPKQRYRNNAVELTINNEELEAGHYQIYQGDSLLRYISINYNRKESELDLMSQEDFDAEALKAGIKFNFIDGDVGIIQERIESESNGIRLWKYFIALSLVFLGIEILLLRLIN